MNRSLIDRWTDTTAFSCVLIVSAVMILPVLAIGVSITVIGGGAILMDGSAIDIAEAVFAFLSIGGVLGFVGYVRALVGARKPERHNVTATLLCLTAGVISAVVVSGFALAPAVLASMEPWSAYRGVGLVPAPFAVASLVWAVAGIAWIRRLPRRYAERTGRAFDGIPGLLLFVSLALATAALLVGATLWR